ncbi:hypothetical protein NDU88_006819 [Pleurodeles waltl]|uniref:Ig-like domain-containing protein n=1 Tax=Pleurodeles waltl TaxID=8319 RepID=A0AAV7LRJ2_PLEWA|nr:hypothetical protein NDU88_006819 [Pleurodeles waltl]
MTLAHLLVLSALCAGEKDFIVKPVIKKELLMLSMDQSPLVLTQPASVSVNPGGQAQIPCSGSLVSERYIHWYQQRLGGAPLLVMYKDKERPEGVPDRFSGSSADNTATLTITGARPEDDADYYCSAAVDFGTGHSERERRGSETKTSLAPTRTHCTLSTHLLPKQCTLTAHSRAQYAPVSAMM